MVVLAACIMSKAGKALVSRQYVEMSRIRMEGLLATFPKLVGNGKQHTYVEIESFRYVYQPMESVYLLLITPKRSNMLEDQYTLQLLSKLVPEYVPSLDEEGICRATAELVSAFDEVISGGHKENVANVLDKQYVELESYEEELHNYIFEGRINENKDAIKRNANETDKSRMEKARADKGRFASSMPVMVSSKFDYGLGDKNSSMGGGMRSYSSGFESALDIDVYKSKAFMTSATSRGSVHFSNSTKPNPFLESLKAHGEVAGENTAPRPFSSSAAAPIMGVHILDDETGLFYSRQVSNASSNMGGVPSDNWGVDSGRPVFTRQESGPLTPPPGSRPLNGILYPGQFGNGSLVYHGPPAIGRTGAFFPGQVDLGSDTPRAPRGIQFSEMLFKKLVKNGMQSYDGVKKSTMKRGEGSSETLDRHFGHYSPDLRYNNNHQDNEDSVSPTSTLDTRESSPSTESDRFYLSRTPNIGRYVDAPKAGANPRPSSQLAQCLLSLTAMADDTTDEDDIIYEQPSTTAPLWHTPPERPVEPHLDWPIVQFQAPTSSKPQHRHPERNSKSPKNGKKTIERWSSDSSSWNLSLLAKPKATVTRVPLSGSGSGGSKPKRHSKRHSTSFTLREVHNGASSSTAVLTYDRSGDAHGRHKWERDSSSSSPSATEIGFEAYDRPGEMVHTLDEEDFPFSPIASSFVFGEHNNSVEFSQRGGGRSGIPRSVGPIVHEFASSHFEIQDFQESMSTASDGSYTYSLDSGFSQPELDWIPTKSFRYLKGPSVEIVELGTPGHVFNGYIEINHSGRFSIDLQRGPRLERHLSSQYNIEKTPDVLLRIVEEAHSMSARRHSSATKYACLSNCRCLPVPKKGLLGRCLSSSHHTHRVAVANSFESRLRSRSLGSVNTKHQSGPFQQF